MHSRWNLIIAKNTLWHDSKQQNSAQPTGHLWSCHPAAPPPRPTLQCLPSQYSEMRERKGQELCQPATSLREFHISLNKYSAHSFSDGSHHTIAHFKTTVRPCHLSLPGEHRLSLSLLHIPEHFLLSIVSSVCGT